ncbi:hypothetical protein OPKNFCMD_1999 [Methylobacterium crusticola]|uniref:Uncharacterized protein n=1 Tax=Methylobacterium crusticola TaxID=1697972 RepID=A0ABQ4QWI9_9HYPH|nr:hypothetical protein [Methylobacterium crusticola]GJD49269.1 hypothetical protein OPKNFCMD_1999 [Methylobacterium crusticola]
MDGDRVEDGVCGAPIAEAPGVGAPTPGEHGLVLTGTGPVRPKRLEGWTMYRRDEPGIRAARQAIEESM